MVMGLYTAEGNVLDLLQVFGISHSTKSDLIHGIIMNPLDELGNLMSDKILGKKVVQSSYNTLDNRTRRDSNTTCGSHWKLLLI